jgi:hypothetical protein
MHWYRRHWYDVGLAVALAVLVCGVLVQLSTIQQILLLSFVVLLLHEFEEYGWPGGLPTFMNEVMRPGGRIDRYPVNQNNSVAVNVYAGYPFYALPIFFPARSGWDWHPSCSASWRTSFTCSSEASRQRPSITLDC